MITLKGVLFGIGLSVVGTIVYFSFLFWDASRSPLPPGIAGTGSVGIDVVSLFYHNGFHVPVYWLFVLGLLLTGIGIVALWPDP